MPHQSCGCGPCRLGLPCSYGPRASSACGCAECRAGYPCQCGPLESPQALRRATAPQFGGYPQLISEGRMNHFVSHFRINQNPFVSRFNGQYLTPLHRSLQQRCGHAGPWV